MAIRAIEERRIYLLELTATEKSWMASASWSYPRDQLTLLKRQAQREEASAPLAQGVQLGVQPAELQ